MLHRLTISIFISKDNAVLQHNCARPLPAAAEAVGAAGGSVRIARYFINAVVVYVFLHFYVVVIKVFAEQIDLEAFKNDDAEIVAEQHIDVLRVFEVVGEQA